MNKWRTARENLRVGNPITETAITKQGIEKYLQGDDVVISPFHFGGTSALLVCVDGLVSEENVDEGVLNTFFTVPAFRCCKSQKCAVALLRAGVKTHPSTKQVFTLREVVEGVLAANFAVVFETEGTAFLYDIKGFEKRSIEAPDDGEGVLKGSKDGFTEPLRINTATVRRHIRSHELRIKQIEVGDTTSTTVALVYMSNIADHSTVTQVESALRSMDPVGIVSTGQVEQSLSGNAFSLFPKVISTQRADKFCANVLDGRVGVIVDGYPVTFVAPGNLAMFFQTPDDYAYSPLFASTIRVVRYACLLVSLLLPALYLAVVTYHAEIIPSRLAQSILSAKVGVPFSAFFEVFFMLVAFEVLIEAGLRLPQGMGQTVSIVAGLVVGDAAINARLVSPAVVMVMAIAGITCFAIPYQDLSNPVRLVRLLFILSAQLFSLFGVVLSVVATLVYLNSIESYGLPYLAPFSQYGIGSWLRDTLVIRRFGSETPTKN